MSRNMIEANKYIFGELADFVKANQTDVVIDRQKKRCIETNDEDKEWLKSLNIINDKYYILPNFQTASFQYDGNDYFVTIGVQEYLENDREEVIQLLELNAGIVTALLSELKISVDKKVDPYQIIEEIFYPSEDEMILYNFSKVKDFFEPIFVYKIPKNSTFLSLDKINISRISGFYTVKSSQLISLNFSPNTLNEFEKLFIEGSQNIPYESLLSSLVSVSWKYSFLDVYRCIERLFPISALEDLHKKLNIVYSLLNFADDIESYIGWRPKENGALNKLINYSPKIARQMLCQIKGDIKGIEEAKLGDFIYKIRNSIVHFRPAIQPITSKLDDNNWNRLIHSCLLVIEYWYAKYEPQLTDSNYNNDET